MSNSGTDTKPLVGVLSIQGAFEEHQACLEASGCRTKQVRTRVGQRRERFTRNSADNS